MKLGAAPDKYDAQDQNALRAALERADSDNHKRTGDIEVGQHRRVILTDSVSGYRYALSMENGVLTTTVLT